MWAVPNFMKLHRDGIFAGLPQGTLNRGHVSYPCFFFIQLLKFPEFGQSPKTWKNIAKKKASYKSSLRPLPVRQVFFWLSVCVCVDLTVTKAGLIQAMIDTVVVIARGGMVNWSFYYLYSIYPQCAGVWSNPERGCLSMFNHKKWPPSCKLVQNTFTHPSTYRIYNDQEESVHVNHKPYIVLTIVI